MSITGHLQQVSPELMDRLRSDPTARERLVISGAFTSVGEDLDAPPEVLLDTLLIEALPVPLSWMVRMVPGFVRRWVFRRLMTEGGARPSSTPSLADLPERDVDDPDVMREILMEAGYDEEEIEEQLAQLAEDREFATGDPPSMEPDPPPGAGPHLGLDKDWHLVHAALAGSVDQTEDPAGQAVLGGDEVGEDLGYGPLRLLSPEEAARIAAWLQEQTPRSLARSLRKSPVRDDEALYGGDWLRRGGSHEVLELRLKALQSFYAGAAERGAGVALWLG